MTREVNFEGLAELWSTIADANLPLTEGAQEVLERAYSIEVDPETRMLRVGFAYDRDEAYAAFKDGADIVGMLAPDTSKITSVEVADGYIIYVEMAWEDDDDDGEG